MIAQVHARALAELSDRARLRVVVGRNASTSAALAARYGVVAIGLGTVTSVIASCAWWRGQSYYDSAAWRGT